MLRKLIETLKKLVVRVIKGVARKMYAFWKEQTVMMKALDVALVAVGVLYGLFWVGTVALAAAPFVSVGAFLAGVMLSAYLINKLIKHLGKIFVAAKEMLSKLGHALKRCVTFLFDVLIELLSDIWVAIKCVFISVIATPYWVLLYFTPITSLGVVMFWCFINLNLGLFLGFYLWNLVSKYRLVYKFQERRKREEVKAYVLCFDEIPTGIL